MEVRKKLIFAICFLRPFKPKYLFSRYCPFQVVRHCWTRKRLRLGSFSNDQWSYFSSLQYLLPLPWNVRGNCDTSPRQVRPSSGALWWWPPDSRSSLGSASAPTPTQCIWHGKNMTSCIHRWPGKFLMVKLSGEIRSLVWLSWQVELQPSVRPKRNLLSSRVTSYFQVKFFSSDHHLGFILLISPLSWKIQTEEIRRLYTYGIVTSDLNTWTN